MTSSPDAPVRLQDLILLELSDADGETWRYLGRVEWLSPKGVAVRLPDKSVLPPGLRQATGILVTQVSLGGSAPALTMLEVVSRSPLILTVGIDEPPGDLPEAVQRTAAATAARAGWL